MIYTTIPYINDKDYFGRNPIRHGYHRINIRTLKKVPTWCNLLVRNGCCVQYKGGYCVPVKETKFNSVQEVGKFLHTAGRKGLYYILRLDDHWKVFECKRVASKSQAKALADLHLFGHAYRGSDNELILFV